MQRPNGTAGSIMYRVCDVASEGDRGAISMGEMATAWRSKTDYFRLRFPGAPSRECVVREDWRHKI